MLPVDYEQREMLQIHIMFALFEYIISIYLHRFILSSQASTVSPRFLFKGGVNLLSSLKISFRISLCGGLFRLKRFWLIPSLSVMIVDSKAGIFGKLKCFRFYYFPNDVNSDSCTDYYCSAIYEYWIKIRNFFSVFNFWF